METEIDLSRLDMDELHRAADQAAINIFTFGSASVSLAPGDMTLYRISIVDSQFDGETAVKSHGQGTGERFWIASNFGGMLDLNLGFEMEPYYVTDKMVENGNLHTGAVLCEFINRMRARMDRAGVFDA